MSSSMETEFPIEVIRTDRKKSASIKIVGGQVQVVVPKNLSDKRLQELIRKKIPWIRERFRIQSEVIPVKLKEYVSGDSFTYLGRNYRLKLTPNGSDEIKLKGGRLELGVIKDSADHQGYSSIKEKLILWYRNHAEQRLKEKTRRYAKILGVEPKSVSVKDYKSRWGSCSIHGDISYNWRVIIAPHRIVDYVVVHELCHLKHPNHSPAYWKSVKREISDYEISRQWLKEHGWELVV